MQSLATYYPGRGHGNAERLRYGFCSGVGGVMGAIMAGQLWKMDDGPTAYLPASGFPCGPAVLTFCPLTLRLNPAPPPHLPARHNHQQTTNTGLENTPTNQPGPGR